MNHKDVSVVSIIWANIIKYQYLYGLSDDRLASYLNVSTRSLINYRHDPGKISLEQVQSFVEGVGISMADLIKE